MVYRYTDYVVNVDAIDNHSMISRRSKLTVTLNSRGNNSILVIMMNPSKATHAISDKTVNGVIKYAQKNMLDVRTIVVLNLYTVYETASGKLDFYVKKYGIDYATGNDADTVPKNDFLIRSEAGKAKKIIVAWGKARGRVLQLKDCKYHERVVQVLSMLQGYEVLHFDTCLRDNMYPKHPVMIRYKWPLKTLQVTEIINKIKNKFLL